MLGPNAGRMPKGIISNGFSKFEVAYSAEEAHCAGRQERYLGRAPSEACTFRRGQHSIRVTATMGAIPIAIGNITNVRQGSLSESSAPR